MFHLPDANWAKSMKNSPHAQRSWRGVADGSMGPGGDFLGCCCCRFCDCGLGARGGAEAGVLPADLKEDEAAAASGADGLGAGDVTASRADSLLSMTQMMSLIAFVAMDGSLRTSRRISTSYMPASKMSRTTESV